MSVDADATEFVDGVAAAAAYAGIAAPRVKIRPSKRANAEAKSKRLILVGPDLLRDAPPVVQRWVAAHEVGHIVGGHVGPTRSFPYAGAGLIALIGMGLGLAGITVGAAVACAGAAGVLFAVGRSVRIGRLREAEADTFANAIASLSPADVRFLLGDDCATPSFLRKHRPHAERLIFDRADDADLAALRQEVAAVRAELSLPRSPLICSVLRLRQPGDRHDAR